MAWRMSAVRSLRTSVPADAAGAGRRGRRGSRPATPGAAAAARTSAARIVAVPSARCRAPRFTPSSAASRRAYGVTRPRSGRGATAGTAPADGAPAGVGTVGGRAGVGREPPRVRREDAAPARSTSLRVTAPWAPAPGISARSSPSSAARCLATGDGVRGATAGVGAAVTWVGTSAATGTAAGAGTAAPGSPNTASGVPTGTEVPGSTSRLDTTPPRSSRPRWPPSRCRRRRRCRRGARVAGLDQPLEEGAVVHVGAERGHQELSHGAHTIPAAAATMVGRLRQRGLLQVLGVGHRHLGAADPRDGASRS